MVPAKQFHLNATTALTSGESYASYVPIFAELRATSFKSESADGSAEIQDLCANQPVSWVIPTKLRNSLSQSNRSRFG